MRLEEWGWNREWSIRARSIKGVGEFGRVLREDRRRLAVITERGLRRAVHSGSGFSRGAASPTVGDWVYLSADQDPDVLARIVDLLPRRAEILRTAKNGTQVIAANVDHAWLLVDSSRVPNLASVERYLIAIEESGAIARLLLSKIDVSPSWQDMLRDLSLCFPDVPALGVSSVQGDGLAQLVDASVRRLTHCLLGESGTGKSTLINSLAQREIARTGEVRASDRKGRHVTTHRELFQLHGGALFLDTPGMRELVPVLPKGVVPKRFDRIIELAAGCRFSDCRHENEPDCQVREAIEQGRLPRTLWENYRRLMEGN